MIDKKYLFQFLLSKKDQQYKIINTSSAFFETNLKRYFTHYFFTKCFIYIVRNPIEIFRNRKKFNPKNIIEIDITTLFKGVPPAKPIRPNRYKLRWILSPKNRVSIYKVEVSLE